MHPLRLQCAMHAHRTRTRYVVLAALKRTAAAIAKDIVRCVGMAFIA